ncbi:MAG: hypothetical protein FD149_801 [Rhodospirillaceae bacterium]|nr:MAG: hypothetical protein FD149_801 [Rhodospirillaceae bacterium]
MVHKNGNAQKHHQPIQPRPHGKSDHERMASRGQRFWRRFVQTKENLSQPPARQGKGMGVQVWHVQGIHQQEIPVKAQKGTRVDEKRADRGGGGQRERH